MDWKDKLSQLAQKENITLTPLPTLSAIDKQKAEQHIVIILDNHHRKGRSVTLISGFMMPQSEIERVAQTLKRFCGVGGSYRDDEILLQGDFRKRALEVLLSEGYCKTKIK